MTAFKHPNRWKLSGIVSLAALAGAATGAVLTPAATAAKDPCTASEVARTVGKVVTSTADYLDRRPETNQVLTSALQQNPGPASVGMLKSYFDANPNVQSDLHSLTEPLTDVSDKCKFGLSLPQVLGLLQAAQGQGGLPGGSPGALPDGLPGGALTPLGGPIGAIR